MAKPTRCIIVESTFEAHGPPTLWIVDGNPQSAATQIQQYYINGTKNPEIFNAARRHTCTCIDQSDLDPTLTLTQTYQPPNPIALSFHQTNPPTP